MLEHVPEVEHIGRMPTVIQQLLRVADDACTGASRRKSADFGVKLDANRPPAHFSCPSEQVSATASIVEERAVAELAEPRNGTLRLLRLFDGVVTALLVPSAIHVCERRRVGHWIAVHR